MKWVWNAPATASGRTRAPPGGSAASFSSASSAPAATICPAPLRLAAVSPAASIAATTSAGSPPSSADIPVGVSAHAAAVEADGLGRRERPRDRGRGQLADAVAGDQLLVVGRRGDPELGGGDDPGRDEQRLGDGGVLDLVGAGGRAETPEVEAGDLGE